MNQFCGAFLNGRVIASEIAKIIREKFFTVLLVLMSDPHEVWATHAILDILKREDGGVKRIVKLDSEVKKIRKVGVKTLKSLRKMVIL